MMHRVNPALIATLPENKLPFNIYYLFIKTCVQHICDDLGPRSSLVATGILWLLPQQNLPTSYLGRLELPRNLHTRCGFWSIFSIAEL